MKSIITLLSLLSFSSFAQYLTVNETGEVVTMSKAALGGAYGNTFDQSAFDQFDGYAKTTGGKMGFCPQVIHLPTVMDAVLNTILEDSREKQDIVLVLDTTGSMGDEIESVKENLVRLIGQLKESSEEKSFKVSVILYKDSEKPDPYVAKILIDLSSDLEKISEELKKITVSGGGDHPEAVLDAFELVAEQVHFRLNSSKSIIVLGDAPGHLNSKTTGKSTDEVLDLFFTADGSVKISPILVSNISGPVPGFEKPVELPVIKPTVD